MVSYIDTIGEKYEAFGLERNSMFISDTMLNFPCVSVVTGNFVTRLPMYNWCQDNFGDNWLWIIKDPYDRSETKFYFIHPEDAIIFRLRWAT